MNANISSMAATLPGACVRLSGVVLILQMLNLLLPGEESFVKRGNDAMGKRDSVLAIECYSEAIKLDPDNKTAYNNRGIVYEDGGKHDKAIADFNEAIRIDPEYAVAFYSRGRSFAQKGDIDHAVEDFSKSISLDPDFSQNYFARGKIYKAKGDFDNAIRDFSELIRLNHALALAHFSRAGAYEGKGDYRNALQDYNDSVIINPENAETNHALARLLAMCPMPEIRNGREAMGHAKSACELTKWKSPEMINTLAAACAEAGDFEHAIEWERKYLETHKLDQKLASEGKRRLALYQEHKPYHAAK